MADTPERVEFFFDPICPWCWITSRWVHEVAAQRPVEVAWRFISLSILNEDKDYDREFPPAYPVLHGLGRSMLRVAAAARGEGADDAVGRLYTEYGLLLHNGGASRRIWDGGEPGDLITPALHAAGLPPGLADQAHEPSWDELLRAETDLAIERTGPDVGTPIITFDTDRPEETSLFGPVIRRIPRGPHAVELWDAVGVVARSGVAELKRTARGEISFD